MNCQHEWRAIDWSLYPTYLIPPELRGHMPEAKICRRCWLSDDKGVTKLLADYQATKDAEEANSVMVRKARIL